MGLETKRVQKIKERLAQCSPAEIEHFFKFVDDQVVKSRKSNEWIQAQSSKDEYYTEELRLDIVNKVALFLKS